MFTNKTLKLVLPAAMLFASATAFAQGTITNAKGETKTWAEFAAALSGAGDITTLTQQLTTAQQDASLVDPKFETGPKGWLKEQRTAANAFLAAYTGYAVKNDDSYADQGVIYYDAPKDRDGETVLTVSFIPATGLQKTNAKGFYDNVMKKGVATVTTVFVDLGSANYNVNDGLYQVTSYDVAQQKNIVTLVANVFNTILPADKLCQDNDSTEAYAKAMKEVYSLKEQLKTAQAAQTDYTTITLKGNITAETTIANYSGTIIGGGYVINAPEDAAVFTTFGGSLSKAAVNGEFAGSNKGASFDNVALYNDELGTFYNANGVATENLSLGELGYAARNSFGVEAGKGLAKLDKSNKVYSITIYTSATTTSPYYVTAATKNNYIDADNGNPVTVEDNQFIKSATSDLAGTNVFYNGKAKEVVITDREYFYCPEDILAETVTYERKFEEGYNALCLPFGISDTNVNGTLAVYEKEDETENKFWFTLTKDKIDPYTPILMVAKADCQLSGLSNVNISKTPAMIVDGQNGSYGILKNTGIQEIRGASKATSVLGLTTNNGEVKFMYGGDKAEFPAFRMVITTDKPTPSSAAAAPRVIGFRDEMGNEIDLNQGGTSSIDDVDTDADFNVVGGVGEITVNSSANGNVVVYTMDGRVAANTKVAAGANKVNVAAGLYVVNGKKVVVK